MKILDNFDQGSLAWIEQRCGRITMSRAKDLLTAGKGVTRQNYILDVVAEKLSGEPIEGYYGIDMERGNFLEGWALRAVQEQMQIDVKTVGFVLHDDDRIGCSPDALSTSCGVEIKCPKPRQHIKNALHSGMDDYLAQVQGSMWVCEATHWYLVSFCPWVKQYPLHIERIERDDAMIEKIAAAAIEAANTVDDLCAKAAAQSTPIAVMAISDLARDAWDNVLAENDEVRL